MSGQPSGVVVGSAKSFCSLVVGSVVDSDVIRTLLVTVRFQDSDFLPEGNKIKNDLEVHFECDFSASGFKR